MVFDTPDLRGLDSVWRRLTSGDSLESLIGVAYTELSRLFKEALRRIGAECLGATLYGLRHCGPSADRAANIRPLIEAKKRGRWLADQSVRRYEKSGRVLEQMKRLAPALQARGLNAEKNIIKVLQGTYRP